MSDTLFARIARGDLPCARVLETDHALAFLDIHPVNLGHVLLIPKQAHRTVADLPDDLAAHLGSLLPRLCRAVQKVTGAPAFNVIANGGSAAGQTVFHVHWHIIPRYEDDAVRWPWPHSSYGDEARMKAMQDRLVEALTTPG
jgi:histidine triad (HIT) family protein